MIWLLCLCHFLLFSHCVVSCAVTTVKIYTPPSPHPRLLDHSFCYSWKIKTKSKALSINILQENKMSAVLKQNINLMHISWVGEGVVDQYQ